MLNKPEHIPDSFRIVLVEMLPARICRGRWVELGNPDVLVRLVGRVVEQQLFEQHSLVGFDFALRASLGLTVFPLRACAWWWISGKENAARAAAAHAHAHVGHE